MQIILLKEVEDLGHPGDVVTVKDGYARNYLFPRRLAIQATPRALQQIERVRTAEERREARERAEAEKQANRLQAIEVDVVAMVGEQGRLYGSVTAQQIADLLKQQCQIEVDRRRIHLDQPIRTIGAHTVEVQLHRDVKVPITVRVHGSEETDAATS